MYSLVELNAEKAYVVLKLTIILESISPVNHCINLIITFNSRRGTKNYLIVTWPPPYLYPKVLWNPEECQKCELLLFSVSKTPFSFINMTTTFFSWGSIPFPVHMFRRRWPPPLAPGIGHMNLAWLKRIQHSLARMTDLGVGTRS